MTRSKDQYKYGKFLYSHHHFLNLPLSVSLHLYINLLLFLITFSSSLSFVIPPHGIFSSSPPAVLHGNKVHWIRINPSSSKSINYVNKESSSQNASFSMNENLVSSLPLETLHLHHLRFLHLRYHHQVPHLLNYPKIPRLLLKMLFL